MHNYLGKILDIISFLGSDGVDLPINIYRRVDHKLICEYIVNKVSDIIICYEVFPANDKISGKCYLAFVFSLRLSIIILLFTPINYVKKQKKKTLLKF